MIVRGLTLFKQLWLSSENGITMLDPGLCTYVLRSRPDVHIWYCPPVAGFQPCFRHAHRERLRRAQRGMGYRGLRRVCPTHANGNVPQPLPHATPEEISLGRGAFLAMLDVLKPDLVIVRGLTLFKQLWLSSENGITMLAPGLYPYVLKVARMSVSGTATTRRGISAMFPNTRNGRPSGNCISADTPPGLIQVSLTRPDAASRMGPGLVSPEALGL